jgi:hypothetical protein
MQNFYFSLIKQLYLYFIFEPRKIELIFRIAPGTWKWIDNSCFLAYKTRHLLIFTYNNNNDRINMRAFGGR